MILFSHLKLFAFLPAFSPLSWATTFFLFRPSVYLDQMWIYADVSWSNLGYKKFAFVKLIINCH